MEWGTTPWWRWAGAARDEQGQGGEKGQDPGISELLSSAGLLGSPGHSVAVASPHRGEPRGWR